MIQNLSLMGTGSAALVSRCRLAAAGLAAATLLSLAPAAFAQDATKEVDTSRVVAIGGSITEIVYALGEQGKLIARDSTSIFPPEALSLPDVGYMRALSPEGVLSVDPTAIIAIEGSGPPEAIDVLGKASVPMVTVPEKFDREGVLEKIRVVGDVLGVQDKAAKLAETVDADLKAAQEATARITPRKRVLFVLSLQDGRVLASGVGTAADGIIALAGGVNAVTDYPGYKPLTDEAIIQAAPDLVLMMDRGGDHVTQVEEVVKHPAIALTPAGQNKQVVRMDGAFLLGFGPRTAAAAHDLSVALYGDAVAD